MNFLWPSSATLAGSAWGFLRLPFSALRAVSSGAPPAAVSPARRRRLCGRRAFGRGRGLLRLLCGEPRAHRISQKQKTDGDSKHDHILEFSGPSGAGHLLRSNGRSAARVPAKLRSGRSRLLDGNEGCYVISSLMSAAPHHHQPKLSRNQSEILSCLRRAKEPMSAYAILDRVRMAGISHPPTVYRALNELMQKGMVHRLQSRSAFIACGHGVCDGKFAFAICRAMREGGRDSALGCGPGGSARTGAGPNRARAGDGRDRRSVRGLPPIGRDSR